MKRHLPALAALLLGVGSTGTAFVACASGDASHGTSSGATVETGTSTSSGSAASGDAQSEPPPDDAGSDAGDSGMSDAGPDATMNGCTGGPSVVALSLGGALWDGFDDCTGAISCALLCDGTARCWGMNLCGAL